jgi:hypothetical protein
MEFNDEGNVLVESHGSEEHSLKANVVKKLI